MEQTNSAECSPSPVIRSAESLQYLPPHQFFEHAFGKNLGAVLSCQQTQFGVFRNLIRLIHAREILDLASIGPPIESLRVSGDTLIDRGINKDLDEFTFGN